MWAYNSLFSFVGFLCLSLKRTLRVLIEFKIADVIQGLIALFLLVHLMIVLNLSIPTINAWTRESEAWFGSSILQKFWSWPERNSRRSGSLRWSNIFLVDFCKEPFSWRQQEANMGKWSEKSSNMTPVLLTNWMLLLNMLSNSDNLLSEARVVLNIVGQKPYEAKMLKKSKTVLSEWMLNRSKL